MTLVISLFQFYSKPVLVLFQGYFSSVPTLIWFWASFSYNGVHISAIGVLYSNLLTAIDFTAPSFTE